MMLFEMPDVFILLLALVLDQAVGEPPNRVHPVVWMGNLINFFMRVPEHANQPRAVQFFYGVLVTVLTVGIFATGAYFLLAYAKSASVLAYVLLGSLLLKSSFSLRELSNAAVKVKNLLVLRRLPEARSAVRSLVGRDTTGLDEGQVVSATVESVAENSCDSFVAPLLFFLFLGVPGALAYRAINTLDNSIGFRGKYEYLGKFAARLDDAANFIPARITGLIFVLAAWIHRNDPGNALRMMFRDHRKTASPNGGWTMSAMSGALGVRLEKAGHYSLGDARNPLSPSTIDVSLRIMMLMAIVWTAAIMLGKVGYYVTA